MDALSDNEDDTVDPFIVLDSQRADNREVVETAGSTEDQRQVEIIDAHSSILRELEMSKIMSCPETPSPLQGRASQSNTQRLSIKSSLDPIPKIADALSASGDSSETQKSETEDRQYSDASTCLIDASTASCAEEEQTEPQKSANPTSDKKLTSNTSSSSHEFCQSFLSGSSSLSVELTTQGSLPNVPGSSSSSSVPSAHSEIEVPKVISSAESKLSSFSSTYPDTSASSHRSQDTLSIPSSPEFRVPTAYPLHKTLSNTSSSSSGSPVEERKVGGPSKRRCPEVVPGATAGASAESREQSKEPQQEESHAPQQADLTSFPEDAKGARRKMGFEDSPQISSTEVTHIEDPKQQSTPLDMLQKPAQSGLQLSGEPEHRGTTEYLLPDALMSSPSVLSSTGIDGIVASRPMGFDTGSSSNDETKNCFKHDRKKFEKLTDMDSVLPKWVRAKMEIKRIEFHTSSENTDSSPTEEADSPLYQHFNLASQQNASMPQETQEQSSGYQHDQIDQPDSCIFPLQELKSSGSAFKIHSQVPDSCDSDISRVESNRVPSLESASDIKSAETQASVEDVAPSSCSSSQDVSPANWVLSESTRPGEDQSSFLKEDSAGTGLKSSLEVGRRVDTPPTREVFNPPVSADAKHENQALKDTRSGGVSSVSVMRREENEDFDLFLSQSQRDPSSASQHVMQSQGNERIELEQSPVDAAIRSGQKATGESRTQTSLSKQDLGVSTTQHSAFNANSGVVAAIIESNSSSHKRAFAEAALPDATGSDTLSSAKRKKRETSLDLDGASSKSSKPQGESKSKEKSQSTFDQNESMFVYSVVKIIERTKCVKTVTRTIVQEYRTLDNNLLKKTSYDEEGSPEITVKEEPLTCTEDIVSLNSLDINFVEDQEGTGAEGASRRRTPKKSGQKPTRSSPRARLSKSVSKTPPKPREQSRSPRKTNPINPAKSSVMEPELRRLPNHEDEPRNEDPTEKTEYEKLLEISLASEGVTRRQTRSFARKTHPEEYTIGTRGFGKWVDNCYYPGLLEEKISEGRYKMKFDDGNQLVLPTKSIFNCSILPCGQDLFARDSDGSCFYKGTVTKIIRPEGERDIEYEIKLDHDESIKRFKTADIMLDVRQVADRCAASYNEAGTGDHLEAMPSGDEAAPEHLLRIVPPIKKATTKKRRRRARELSELGSSTSPDDRQKRIPPKRRKTEPVAKESLIVADETPFVPLANSNNAFTGPLPTNKNMFRGYAFLITCIEPKEPITDPELQLRFKGFDRKHLKTQISAAGGVVVSSLKSCVDLPVGTTVLVAPVHQRTNKYYFALASGIPCVSHLWVIGCCKENNIIPQQEYRLAAGIDEITKEIVQLPESIKPLRGQKVYIKVQPERMDEIMTLLHAAGSEIVPELSLSTQRDLESTRELCHYIIVGDGFKLQPSLVRKARLHGIPCVSLNWLAQCIVHGCCLEIHQHRSFVYQ